MIPTAPDLLVLRRGRWFGSLPAALQARIAEHGAVRAFRSGQYLVRQGDPPRGMFGILAGRTRHVCAVGEDREVLMHVGGPGLWTGEYPLLSGARSIGSVIADAPTRALYLSANRWQRILDEDPRWMRPFAALVADRFATAFRAYAEAQGLTREAWLLARLRLVAQVEQDHGAPARQITLSQSQLASMVGMSRQTLSAQLARLQARGLVRVGYRSVELLD